MLCGKYTSSPLWDCQILQVFFIVLCNSKVIKFPTDTRSVILNSSGPISLDKKLCHSFLGEKIIAFGAHPQRLGRITYLHQ